MQLGRKIYFDKATGNVLVNIGEMQGDIREATQAEDFASYTALAERVPATVGVIQLAYGQYADKFGVYYYSVNTTTNTLVWGSLINPDAPKPEPTNKEINDNLLTIIDIQLTTYEDMMAKGTV